MSELVSPESPGNALTPIADGWPLRTMVGNAMWKLVPAPARPLARVLSLVPTTLLLGGLLVLTSFGGAHPYFIWLAGKGGAASFGFLAGVAAATARFSSRLVRWQLRKLAALHLTVASLRGSPPGSLVRVLGTVRADAPFAAAVSGLPAVLAHYETRPLNGAPSHQVRGMDFFVDVDGGETVRVAVRDAYLDGVLATVTDYPANLRVVGRAEIRTKYREVRLAPGDRVEALGVLVREVDPTLPAGPGRAPGLRVVLRGSARLPLFLRKL